MKGAAYYSVWNRHESVNLKFKLPIIYIGVHVIWGQLRNNNHHNIYSLLQFMFPEYHGNVAEVSSNRERERAVYQERIIQKQCLSKSN